MARWTGAVGETHDELRGLRSESSGFHGRILVRGPANGESRLKRSLTTVLRLLDARWATVVLLGFGLALRIVVLGQLSVYPLRSDGLSYHKMALQLLAREDFSPYWPPGVPYYLALSYRLFGANELVGRTSMLVVYMALAGLLYVLAREVSGRKAANLCLAVFSVYPTFVHQSVEPLTQLPTAACLVAIAYLVIRMCKQPTWRASLLLGFVLGCAALVRASSLLLALGVPAYVLIRTRKTALAITPLAISFAIVSLWLFKAHRMTGHVVIINYANSRNLFLGNNAYTPLYKTWWLGSHAGSEGAVPPEFDAMIEAIRANPPHVQGKLYTRYAMEHVFSRPDLFLVRTASRLRTYFAFDTYTG